jgi:hypothetical protein
MTLHYFKEAPISARLEVTLPRYKTGIAFSQRKP